MMLLRIAFAAIVAIGCVAGNAQAQDYPTQPVKLVVPFPAGGGTDALARWFAKGLEAKLGQPFVVENRAGSGTTLGAGFVARAAPDGYTIMLGTSSTYAIAPNVYKKVPFDPAKDFAPIALVAEVPFVLVVNPSLPVKSVAELVALVRSKPGAMSYASAGIGTQHHVNAELLKTLTGIEMTHVPYRGGGPALQDVIAGHVPIYFGDVSTVMPLARAGKVRALALTISQRLDAFPIPDHARGRHHQLQCKRVAGLRRARRHAGADRRAAQQGAVGSREFARHPAAAFTSSDCGRLTSTPDELGAFIKSELVRWGKVVDAAGARGIE